MNLKFNLQYLRQKRNQAFGWINATQFLGALNDNVFKALIQMFLIAKLPDARGNTLAIATILFSLPYIFFTPYAGFIADRFSKKNVTVILKYAELVIMLLSCFAFLIGSRFMLFALLFLMSAQSALFSPTKYGILPEIVAEEKLTRANGLLVMMSFIAIILGTVIAPGLSVVTNSWFEIQDNAYGLAAVVCVLIAILGVVTSHQVWNTRPANPTVSADYFFLRQLWRTFKWVRKDGNLLAAVLATGFFSMLAGFMQINLIDYGMSCLGLDEKHSSFMFFYSAIGIAVGAFSAGQLSKRNIEFALIPIGSFLILVSLLVLGFITTPQYIVPVCIFIFTAGLGAGLFIVPLDTFIQIAMPTKTRGEGLALNSFISWVGIAFAGVFMYIFNKISLPPNGGFLFFVIPAGILFIFGNHFLKDFFFRFCATFIVRLIYRVRTIGVENVPLQGPAVLIVNNASYMDSLLLCATTRRRIRFLMSRDIYNRWRWCRPIFRMYGVIPVDDRSSPRQVAMAIREARKALDEGFMVCVFAEGGITRTGTIRAFKSGYARIVKGSNYPIIPVYLGGSWGTIYHYYQGQLVRKWFRMSLQRYRVTVMFGKPMPSTTDAFHVRRAVMELSCDYFNSRKDEHRSLAKSFITEVRRNWFGQAADDTLGMKVTYGKALIASIALARAISPKVKDDKHIGILLPTSCAGMIANITAALLGRSAVNLNFTTSKQAFAHSINQCGMHVIITSRKFVERFPQYEIEESKLVYIEDILRGLTTKTKLQCALAAAFYPLKWMVPATAKTTADDVAMILFSSGSTGEPKGVMLSQHNVISMIESLRMMLATTPEDHICGTLPLFHSFGIMGCIWYPLLKHVRVTMHPNPLDAQAVVDIVRDKKSTMIFGTPTFLSIYARKATREDFKTLRFILAGAEKLKESLIKTYEEKYGVRPYEAYGVTELSPGIAVSVPHGTGGGIVQEGWKTGRVGLPCPGIAMKVLDPDTGEEMAPGEPGLLYLKGPNVMLGYLQREDLTSEVLKDGWYCTGDIAFIDEDGFVGLTDRLSRFSKIAGEMVPHVGVEEALLNVTGLSGQVLAVTGVPDERKGEKLVVLYTPECGDAQWLYEALDSAEIPNLWKPAKTEYYPVESIPLLGTGKVDLSGVKKLAISIVENKKMEK
ncbi:MAG: MFS transporter [Kiritimatiellae bacterium]|nr:MFS transporter [Kiritimatiellia bacterium]